MVETKNVTGIPHVHVYKLLETGIVFDDLCPDRVRFSFVPDGPLKV